MRKFSNGEREAVCETVGDVIKLLQELDPELPTISGCCMAGVKVTLMKGVDGNTLVDFDDPEF